MKTFLLILIALIVVNLVRIYWQNNQVPALGHEQGRLKPLSKKPNSVSTQTEVADKKVEPWSFKTDKATTMEAILEAVSEYGGASIIRQTDDYLYVVFTTEKMRFRDDAEFYLDDKERKVHFRSASRAGYSDMGLNRQRFNRLTELYRKRGVSAIE